MQSIKLYSETNKHTKNYKAHCKSWLSLKKARRELTANRLVKVLFTLFKIITFLKSLKKKEVGEKKK